MPLHRSKLARWSNAIGALLPDQAYFSLIQVLLPLLNERRRWPSCRIRKVQRNLYVAVNGAGNSLYFYERTRARMYLWPNDFEYRMSKMRKKYERGVVRVEPGDVVVDVGANIGEFSMAVSGRASQVIAFEPEQFAFTSLEANSRAYPNIRAEKVLLADETKLATFFVAGKTADSSLIEPVEKYVKHHYQAVTLDEALSKLDINHVDFLKVEAEGAEPEILDGAKSMLQSVRKIAVDGGPERRGKSTAEQVRTRLLRAGFAVEVTANHMVYASRR